MIVAECGRYGSDDTAHFDFLENVARQFVGYILRGSGRKPL
jgi:hypothetical protein